MTVSLSNVQRIRASYGTRIRPTWRWNVPAIEHALELLGVTEPVELVCAEYRRGRWLGMHSFANGAHRVRVARWLGPNAASMVLWHELTHCAQHDRGDDMRHALTLSARARLSDDAYRADPRDAEAAANEANADRYPLVI